MSTSGPISTSETLGTAFRGLERRRHLRRRVLIPATLDVGQENNAVIADISRSGMGLMLPSRQDLSRLCLRFTIPETGALVRATGELRWHDSTGRSGIHLIAIDCKPSEWHGWFEKLKAPLRNRIEWPQQDPSNYMLLNAASAVQKDFTAGHITAEVALQTVVTTTVDVMGYAGAAIVLKEGAKFVCQASAGVAPAAGTTLEPDATLSEQCIRTGQVLICTQTKANSQFAQNSAGELTVLVPLGRSGPVRGMFAVFALSPDAISDQDVSVFSETGNLVDQIFAHAATTPPVPEVKNQEAETILSLQNQLPIAAEAGRWQHLFRWGALVIFMIALLWGVLVGAKPMLRAVVVALRSAASAVSPQNSSPTVADATSNSPKTQIIVVEGSAALPRPVFSEDGTPLKLTQGRLAHRTDIIFPAAAVDAGIAGDVKAVLTISEKGSVEQVDILQGDTVFANEVTNTLGHWRYLPFKLRGKPVSVQLPITVTFLLRNLDETPSHFQGR